ncbi:MAG: hypothetical protein IKX43_02175, partial [Paludibacteraceae bacterium]|nr:hypothetical protein [Paludibacteraceae bacterium]
MSFQRTSSNENPKQPKFKLEVQIQMQKKEETFRPLPKVNYICIAHVQTVNSGAKIYIRSV